MKALDGSKLADDTAERVRRSHHEAIRETQDKRAMGMIVIKDVVLANNTRTPVAHRLGRAPSWIKESCVRGSITVGCVVELRDSADRTQVVEIAASGYGATITIDLLVVP